MVKTIMKMIMNGHATLDEQNKRTNAYKKRQKDRARKKDRATARHDTEARAREEPGNGPEIVCAPPPRVDPNRPAHEPTRVRSLGTRRAAAGPLTPNTRTTRAADPRARGARHRHRSTPNVGRQTGPPPRQWSTAAHPATNETGAAR